MKVIKTFDSKLFGLDDRGFDYRHGLDTTASRLALRPTQPPIQCIPGDLFLGVKRPGRESDHSPPSSAEVKNTWSYTSASQYVFMAWCSVKAQGQCYLCLYLYTLYLLIQRHCYWTNFILGKCFSTNVPRCESDSAGTFSIQI
jgi:hypothetical protein